MRTPDPDERPRRERDERMEARPLREPDELDLDELEQVIGGLARPRIVEGGLPGPPAEQT
jgi:hypothetical protein